MSTSIALAPDVGNRLRRIFEGNGTIAIRARPRIPRTRATMTELGAWRSLVARTVRVGEVPGSNPGAPMSSTTADRSPDPRRVVRRAEGKWIRFKRRTLAFGAFRDIRRTVVLGQAVCASRQEQLAFARYRDQTSCVVVQTAFWDRCGRP